MRRRIIVSLIIAFVIVITFLLGYRYIRYWKETSPVQDVAKLVTPHHEETIKQEPQHSDRPAESPATSATNKTSNIGAEALDVPTKEPSDPHSEGFVAQTGVLRDSTEDVTARNEAANSLRRMGYKGLSLDLIAILNNPTEKPLFRSWCIQHLYNNLGTADEAEKQLIVETFRTCVVDRDIPVQREAVLALVRMGDPLGKETALKWLLDENVKGVHDIAIRCVHMLDLKDQIPAVRKYLYDSDEVVRIAVIVALSEWGDEESRSAFEAASKSDNIRIQRAGKAALERLNAIGGQQK